MNKVLRRDFLKGIMAAVPFCVYFFIGFVNPTVAQEMCLFDRTYTTTEAERGFHHFTVDSGLPANWLEPYNYYEGTFHFRYEIMDYPSTEPFMLSVCIWSDVKGQWKSWRETCAPQLPITGRGVFTTSTTPATWWQINKEEPVDFGRVKDFLKLGIVYWCADRKILSDRVSEDKRCWPQNNLFLPMKMRVTVVAVAKGHEFSGWK